MGIPGVILAELRRIIGTGDGQLEWLDLIRWSHAQNISIPEFYNDIAEAVARSYQGREISYIEADGIVNKLYLNWVLHEQCKTPIPPWPDLFLDIYLAFDGGEYRRTDAKEHDPIVDCTDPAVEAILSRLDS
ncbi:hypothetical protein GCM10017620_12820 [Brevundimonas intermedia]|uniref:Uncharacterized protein n=1 Tax=Brevundimonas intermedia TaxID=74315 RepID=A0ABQ5T6A2_9CAUL|nr:hypothetical protein [Brevundimonas intermedia]GLK48309.1 hypothetical protein GCM10017620_12820 [Brevundimonas intermedia]